MPGRRVAAGSAQKRRQHLLQAADKIVGFSIAFDQSIDGAVFAIDLLAQEVAFIPGNFDLSFELCDIARRLPCRGSFCRALSRVSCAVAASCRGLGGGTGVSMTGGTLSVAPCRDRSGVVALSS